MRSVVHSSRFSLLSSCSGSAAELARLIPESGIEPCTPNLEHRTEREHEPRSSRTKKGERSVIVIDSGAAAAQALNHHRTDR